MAVDLDQVFKEPICLSSISKDTRGELSARDRDLQKCGSPECVTLKVRYALSMIVRSNPNCESVVSRRHLNGVFEAELVIAYLEDGHQRGYHTGNFKWGGSGSTLQGQMCGTTNAGTHRNCEACHARGHMEGQLEGEVVDGELLGCRVVGSYIINFDPSSEGISSAVEGVIEGVLICSCEHPA